MIDYTGMLAAMKRFTDLVSNFIATAPIVYVGEYKQLAGATIPDGWLVCDGRAVSRTTYADLFAELGTAYGAGDGSTTFNLPNSVGRVLRGSDAAVGTSGGHDSVQLSVAQLPAHSMTLGSNAKAVTDMKMASTNSTTASSNTAIDGGVIGTGGTGPGTAVIYSPKTQLDSGTVHYGAIDTTLSGTTDSIGSGQAVDITPSFLGTKTIIAWRGKRPVAA